MAPRAADYRQKRLYLTQSEASKVQLSARFIRRHAWWWRCAAAAFETNKGRKAQGHQSELLITKGSRDHNLNLQAILFFARKYHRMSANPPIILHCRQKEINFVRPASEQKSAAARVICIVTRKR